MTASTRAPPGSLVASWIGHAFLRVTGWRVEGGPPDHARLVIIAAPHTSNWDFVYLLAVAFRLRMRIHWLGKASLFRWPFGALLRRLGGIAVDRSRANSLVSQLAERFERSTDLAIVIPPSGTRRQTGYWKSGFYWTARAANAAVVCGYLDYPRRRAGLGYSFVPGDDVGADMQAVRAFYADIVGRYPQRAREPRLKEEDADAPTA